MKKKHVVIVIWTVLLAIGFGVWTYYLISTKYYQGNVITISKAGTDLKLEITASGPVFVTGDSPEYFRLTNGVDQVPCVPTLPSNPYGESVVFKLKDREITPGIWTIPEGPSGDPGNNISFVFRSPNEIRIVETHTAASTRNTVFAFAAVWAIAGMAFSFMLQKR